MGEVSTNAYSGPSIAGYNNNPPPDDGSESSSNKLEWDKHKTKLADPIKTLAESIDTAVSNAFAKGVNTDADVANKMSGSFGFEWATATIGTDIIAANASAMAVGAESGATQDTLQEITATGVLSGALLTIKQRNATEEINVIHATSTAATATNPNIFLGSRDDFLIDAREKSLTLQYDDQLATATGWYEVARPESGLSKPDFESSEQTVTTTTTLSVSHGLSVIPTLVTISLRCKTAEQGYSVDDEVLFHKLASGTAGQGVTAAADASEVVIVQGSAIVVKNQGSPASDASITVGNWRWVVRAWI